MKRYSVLAATLLLAMACAAQSPRHVDLTAADGLQLKATYYAAEKPGPGVILLHQCNRDRAAWRSLATRLAASGFHVLTMDYRGYGESGGARFGSLSPQERQRMVAEVWPGDVDAALAYLLEQPGVDGGSIGAAGASCGVNQAIQLARRHSRVKTLALLSGGTDRTGREFLEYAAWMPLLAAASADDGGALPAMRWLLGFSSYPQNKMLEYTAAGHGTDMFAVEPGLEPALVGWFDRYLRQAPVKRTLGSPASLGPSAAFWKMLEEPGGPARALAAYREARKKDAQVVLFPEGEVNTLGYQRLQEGSIEDAVHLFELNVAAYPGSANAYDSLGDGYLAAGRKDLARQYALQAIEKLESDPNLNEQARQAIRQSAEQKLSQTEPAAPTTP